MDVLISDSLVRRSLAPGTETPFTAAVRLAWLKIPENERGLWVFLRVLPPVELEPDTWRVRFTESPAAVAAAPDPEYCLILTEEQRQMLLLACATLALERPGFMDSLYALTKDIDKNNAMMQEFVRLNADRWGKAKRIEVAEKQKKEKAASRDILAEPETI